MNEGDEVTIHLTNLERAEDQTHGFTVSKYNVNGSWEPGKTATVKFTADTPGVFPFYCTEFCSALHLEMQGYVLVKPKGYKAKVGELMPKEQYTKADYEKQVADERRDPGRHRRGRGLHHEPSTTRPTRRRRPSSRTPRRSSASPAR